ncbi:hypothetical protein ACM9HF_19500 [Colwellia sp. RE-S-Sl-9]
MYSYLLFFTLSSKVDINPFSDQSIVLIVADDHKGKCEKVSEVKLKKINQ